MNSSNIYIPPVISKPSVHKRIALINEIDKHLASGVISEIVGHDSDIISRVFTVPKKSGGNRMIIDLSKLNHHVNKVSFRMEDREVIKSLINKNDFFVSIDLKDAFHSISLHNDSKRLTTFEFEGKRYAFNVLPFGLTSSPRIYTKILKPVIAFLRSSGIKITHYLDDILICADSYEKCSSHLNKTLSLLVSLGFIINKNKSVLIPSQEITHLGYLWNSNSMSIKLPSEKLIAIRHLVKKCSSGPQPIRTHASLLGRLVSCSNGYKFAPLHYRCFQLDFLQALKFNDSWDSLWSLNYSSISELSWWKTVSLEELTPVSLVDPNPVLTLFCDSSLLGWGASLSSGEIISGKWGLVDSKEHINYLELKAIHLSLIHFRSIFRGKCISIRSDNTTAVFYLNKMGGTHSPKLCKLAISIWKFIHSNSISFIASHISGIENNAADYLSRISHNHEYALSPAVFASLTEVIPFSLNIDIFATKYNKKLPNYCSLFNDPSASFIDAFSFCWPSNIYIFPPIPMIHKTVSKIHRDEVESCILITPAWHCLSILPILKNLLIHNPIFIHSDHLIGYLPTQHPFHLMAWPISASLAKKKGCPPSFLMPSSRALVLPPFSHIQGSGLALLNGLQAENLHPLLLQI